jgi:DNA ligase (NAD+)
MSFTKEELVKRISEAREAYYNLNPIMEDHEYDLLLDSLKKIDPDNAQVSLVGAVPNNVAFQKVIHEIPMGSLDKVNSIEEMNQWIDRIGCEEYFVSHKIDGLSLSVVYEEGKLIRAVTRGDGSIGDDVTHNVQDVKSIPKNINTKRKTVVRGEVYIKKDIFKKHFQDKYANARNTASAKIREKNTKEGHFLDFLAYYINYEEISSMYMLYSRLGELGFETPMLAKIINQSGMEESFRSEESTRECLPYDIDGLVISVNSLSTLYGLGSVNNRPTGQIAWKFEALVGISKIKDVVWQTGNTGRIVPIAIIEPVEIGGVTISRVSLHNLDMFNELKLSPGDRVMISRKNDVIPYLEKNLDLMGC